MRKLKIKVSDGEIVLESIWIVRDATDLVVVYIDTRSKYPEIGSASQRGISVGASDRTLGINQEKKGFATLIDIVGLRGRWESTFEVGRYNVTWVLHKPARGLRGGRLLWENNEEETKCTQ